MVACSADCTPGLGLGLGGMQQPALRLADDLVLRFQGPLCPQLSLLYCK